MKHRSLVRPLLALAALGTAGVLAAAGLRTQPTSPTTPLLPPANGPRRIEPGWHALTGATVHIRPGEKLENATVVVRDGAIVSVDAGAAPPAGAAVWDCSGLQIYAGLIDPYVEVEVPSPPADAADAHWNPRVTPQRSALHASQDRGSPIDARTARSLREMGFTAAAAAPSDGIFRGSAAVVSLGDAEDDPSLPGHSVYRERAYQAVGLSGGRGGRGGDTERWPGYPNSQMGAIALIRQTLSDANWLQQARGAIGSSNEGVAAAALASGFDGSPNALDHLAGGEGAPPLVFDVADELEVLRAAKIAAEFERTAIIVGTGTEFRRLDAIRATARPLIVPLVYPEAPKVDSVGAADEVSLSELMTWEQAPTNVRRLDNAYGAGNIAIALTTSKLPDRRGGRGKFMEHLRTAIRHGLAEDRALALLTVNPAVMLGLDARMGTVEAGKVANLVVADGPLFDKKTKLRAVWIDGRRHELSPAPAPLEGRWQVAMEPPIADPVTLTIKAPRGEPAKIELASPDSAGKEATITAKNVRLDHATGRFSFTFDHEKFGAPGVYTIAGMLEGDTIRGHGVRSDGGRFAWSATPAPAEAPAANAPAGDDKPEKPTKKGDDDSEDEAPTDIPESRAYPFGAYGIDALPPQETLLLTGATIWTSGPQGVIQNGWIMLQGGKIKSVGGGAPPNTPPGGRQIDLAGKHITPGLIDCHSHTGISRGVNESGQAVTAEVRIQDVTDPDSMNWYRQLAGGVTTVNNLHGSANAIGGQNCVNKVRWGVAEPDMMHFEGASPGIKFALGENVKGSNRSEAGTRYPQTRMGVETLIRDRFTAARDYKQAWDTYYKARSAALSAGSTAFPMMPRRDLELEALVEILDGKRLVHCHSYRQDEILMLCRLAEDFGFKIGTFQHNLEGYKVADAIKENAIGASLFSDWWNYKVEVQDAIPYAGPIMHDVGVVVSYNSDSDELARRMNVEAAKAVKYSGGRITPEEALKFVTINPAIQLRIDGSVGSLEGGKDADLVVWSGPPLSTLSRCETVYIDGREYFSLERDARLRQANAAERTRLIQKILTGGKKKGRGKEGEKPEGDDAAAPDSAPDAGSKPPSFFAADVLDGELRSGRRGMLFDARRQADAARRELFLDMLRRGIDPDSARCGDCGMLMTEMEAHQ